MKAWKAALAAALATAAISFVAFAPAAQSGKGAGKLKIVNATSGTLNGAATTKCPKGYVLIGGGFTTAPGNTVFESLKRGERAWSARAVDATPKGGVGITAMAICGKGSDGFKVIDGGEVDHG
jgi:hypothetical protein